MRPLSSASVDPNGMTSPDPHAVGSVRSGSGFWAAGHRSGSGTSSSAFTAFSGAQSSGLSHSHGHTDGLDGSQSHAFRDSYGEYGMNGIPEGRALHHDDDADHDSQGTEKRHNGRSGNAPRDKDKKRAKKEERDELAAQDAFIAGMIYSLGQRILPGAPYTPSAVPYAQVYGSGDIDTDRGRWKLEDCLRSVLSSVHLTITDYYAQVLE